MLAPDSTDDPVTQSTAGGRATGLPMAVATPWRVIDLFAGAGGLTLGFSLVRDRQDRRVFRPIWASDFNRHAAATYNANFGGHCRHGDILDLLADPDLTIPQADVVIGGPPCQGFSLLNKNRREDHRKQLWRPYMDIVRRSGARVFVMENVRQLLGSAELDEIREVATALGFETADALLCAADYGVPQERYRAFVVGRRDGSPSPAFPPPRRFRKPGNEVRDDRPSWRTVKQAIADLPAPEGTAIRDLPGPLNLHFGRTPTEKSRRRYRAVPPGGNRFDLQRNAPHLTPDCWLRKTSGGTDLFGRLWWDRPSVTIRTEFFKPEKGRYLHPEAHRPITHREAARLQSFPDEFVFKGSKAEIARQIGNAVPPLLGRAVAESVASMLWEHRAEDS